MSTFRLQGVRLLNQDVRVDWATVGGHSYVVQLVNAAGGSPTNFLDLSQVIAVGGTNEGMTNYVHLNAVTNRSGVYRVRLQP